ncbi:Dirigent protein [Dillenia turbinata]|uniref:Dirigent protein n=1 Tax=Dillenia turbinata TaxID=194707 RepID=A0AAN8UNG3_9MAGN
MAQSKISIASLASLLLLALTITIEAKPKQQKQTNLVFFMHDWESGDNITAVAVAGLPNKPWKPLAFGTLFAIDDDLTTGVDRKSAQIGRAHGLYVYSALDGSDCHMLLSLVFTSKEYSGSTLEIQGADRLLQKSREVSVVSGTGKFRLARGYATLETAFLDLPNSNAILKWNVTVFHY